MSGYKLHNTPASRDYHYFDRKTHSTALMYACCNARIDDALKIIEIYKDNYKYTAELAKKLYVEEFREDKF